MSNVMQSLRDKLMSWGSGCSQQTASPPSDPEGRVDRLRALAGKPWVHAVSRVGLSLGAIVVLSWLGARSNAEPLPAGKPDPQLASLVTVAASPAPSVRPSKLSEGSAVDAGERTPAHRDSDSRARTGILPDGRIVLNQANTQELCKLPAVGPSRARKIVALRERLGRFRSLRQLLRVRGIGPRTLRRLRPLLVLDAPSAPVDAG